MQAWLTRRAAVALAAGWGLAGRALAQAVEANRALFFYKGADRDARLLKQARQEGSVSVYTSLAPTEGKPLADAFEAKYGVKVNMWRGLSDGVVQRAVTEARGRRHLVDVIETNGPEMESLAREQLLAEFYSPHLSDIPARAIPSHRQWIPDRLNLYVVAYNPRKVRADELPKSYEGFLDPKWKRRIALESTDAEWMGSLAKVWGEPRAMDFFQKLAEMKPEMRKGHILLVQLVAAGEVDVALTAYYANAASAKQRGAPVEWAAVEPTIARPQGVGIARQAPHPNAALLFADFLLSPLGQGMLAGMGRVPVSTAVKSDAGAINYAMSDPSMILDENDRWQQQWDRLFLKK